MREQTLRTLCTMTLGGLILWGTAATARADTILFQDNFSNGSPADSNGVPATGTGFWKVLPPAANTGFQIAAEEMRRAGPPDEGT